MQVLAKKRLFRLNLGSVIENQIGSSRKLMDDVTAMAFAGNAFEQLHPRNTCPEWLPRCTVISYHFDDDKNYIVSFSVTPLATNNAVRYFQVLVNSSTGETAVLIDEGTSSFVGSELQGYATASS